MGTIAAVIPEEAMTRVNRFLDAARAEDLRRRRAEAEDLHASLLPMQPPLLTGPFPTSASAAEQFANANGHGQKHHSCTFCGKGFKLQFPSSSNLRLHTRTHTGKSSALQHPNMCTFCGKGFKRSFDLKVHTRVHTGKPPALQHPNVCTLHSTTRVSGVRPYKCELCEKAFTLRSTLEMHMLKIHGKNHSYAYMQRRSKVFVCEECGFTTEQWDEYAMHLRLLRRECAPAGNVESNVELRWITGAIPLG